MSQLFFKHHSVSWFISASTLIRRADCKLRQDQHIRKQPADADDGILTNTSKLMSEWAINENYMGYNSHSLKRNKKTTTPKKQKTWETCVDETRD